MSLAVLVPYRPDTPQRERIFQATQRLWARLGVEMCVANDGLDGHLFSYARAANRARAMTEAKVLIAYNCDALPLSLEALQNVESALLSGTPWSTLFTGQRHFTEEQTERLIAGAEPGDVGEPQGGLAMGREALLAIRADVWDDLRGMDERFIGWGPEDLAWHYVLKTLYPDGDDVPRFGLFRSLWHPTVTREAFPRLDRLWRAYQRHGPETLRTWYLSR